MKPKLSPPAAWFKRPHSICLAICLAMIGIALAGCADEQAKWTFARAMNLGESGELEQAIELMHEAMEQLPDDPRIKLHLAYLLAENGQGEIGIGLCEGRLEVNCNDVAARHVQSTCLKYLGRFDESLAEYKRCLSGRVSRTPTERNDLAYYRGLANKELCKAANDIQIAIEAKESEYWGCPFNVPLQVRAAIAAGLIARHIDQHQHVLTILDRKIDQYESRMAIQNSLIKLLIAEKIQLEFPFSENTENDLLNARGVLEVERYCLGLMLTTRGLIREDISQTDQADNDRQRVSELGFEFTELAQQLPNPTNCLASLDTSAVYLDTRGFISGRREWQGEATRIVDPELERDAKSRAGPGARPSSYLEALEDLNFAVVAAQYGERALDSSLYNKPDFSAQQVARLKKMARKTTAVLLYHRMEIHQRGGNSSAADEDQRRIEELGFQPGASLF